MSIKNIKKTIPEHLSDVKKIILINLVVFLVIFFTTFYFSKDIYNFFALSLKDALLHYNITTNFIITSVTEAFFSYVKLSFYITTVIFIPLFLLSVFIFMFSSLYVKEKKIALLLIILLPVLFTIGIIIAYYFGLQVIWMFFIEFSLLNNNNNIQLLPSTLEYITFVLNIMLVFGLSLELPLIIVILYILNFITEQHIIKYARYAIVVAFIIAAIITPPDPLSQIIVALILIILYFLSYYLIKLIKVL